MQTASSRRTGRVRAEAPAWAKQLVVMVCKRFKLKVPKLEWWRERNSIIEPADVVFGHVAWKVAGAYQADDKVIRIIDSSDRIEAKINLLHELAHHIHSSLEGDGDHTESFWKLCWGLYRHHRIPLERAIYSEFAYLAGAEKSFMMMGFKLDEGARVAAKLGTKTRRKKQLAVQIRRLKGRLLAVQRKRDSKPLKREVRALTARHLQEVQAIDHSLRVYKRISLKRR